MEAKLGNDIVSWNENGLHTIIVTYSFPKI